MYWAAHKAISEDGFGAMSYTSYPSKAAHDAFMNGYMKDGTNRPIKEVYRCFAQGEDREMVYAELQKAWAGEIVV